MTFTGFPSLGTLVIGGLLCKGLQQEELRTPPQCAEGASPFGHGWSNGDD